MRARAARSAEPEDGHGGGSIAWRARVTGGMVGSALPAHVRAQRADLRRHAGARLRGHVPAHGAAPDPGRGVGRRCSPRCSSSPRGWPRRTSGASRRDARDRRILDRGRAPPLLVPRRNRGAARDRPAHRPRREGRAGRAERRGQVDVHAAPQRDPSAHPRLGAGGGVERGGSRRAATPAPGGRAGLPGSRRPALQPDGLRRCRLRPAPPRHGGR